MGNTGQEIPLPIFNLSNPDLILYHTLTFALCLYQHIYTTYICHITLYHTFKYSPYWSFWSISYILDLVTLSWLVELLVALVLVPFPGRNKNWLYYNENKNKICSLRWTTTMASSLKPRTSTHNTPQMCIKKKPNSEARQKHHILIVIWVNTVIVHPVCAHQCQVNTVIIHTLCHHRCQDECKLSRCHW